MSGKRRNAPGVLRLADGRAFPISAKHFEADIARLVALGLARRAKPTQRDIARRLDEFEEGLKGADAERLPPHLRDHLADMHQALRDCRRLLDAGDLKAAATRVEALERLLAELAAQAQLRRAGRAPKRIRELQAHVDRLVADSSSCTARQVWESFPEATPGAADDDLPIYRDDGRIVVIDDQTGRGRSVTFATFKRYVARAKAAAEE